MERIYFDNNATTPLDPGAREAMLPYLDEYFGNPSSGHRFGEQALAGINNARDQVAFLLNCASKRLFFTSGGTEANNTAIWSAITAFPDKKHIITSVVEHPSILKPLEFLQQRFGYTIELLPVSSDGGLDLQQLAASIRTDTALVTLMGANNESGVVWPLEDIGELVLVESFREDEVHGIELFDRYLAGDPFVKKCSLLDVNTLDAAVQELVDGQLGLPPRQRNDDAVDVVAIQTHLRVAKPELA